MPLAATTLVLLSCFGHACWNLLAKRSRNPLATLWWSLLCAAVLVAPVSAVYFLLLDGGWPTRVWIYFCLSSVSRTLYIYCLARGYGSGDLSVVYPIARSAPLFVALWAMLWLHEHIDTTGGVGIVMVVVAAMTLASPPSIRGTSGTSAAAVGWAVAAALFSSFYSVIDRAAMLQLHGSLARGAYLHLTFAAMGLGLTVLDSRSRPWRHLPGRNGLLSCAAIGLLALGTYLMVLFAFAMPAAKTSYVVAMRQFSSIVGVLFGWRLLGEPRGWLRLISVIVMVAGLVLVAGPWHN